MRLRSAFIRSPTIHIYFANWRDRSRGGVDLRHALYHFGITKQGSVRGGGTHLLHPSSWQLYLASIPSNPPCVSPPVPPSFPLAAPLTRVVTLSEYRNFSTARFRQLGGRRHFATYFACLLTRVWSKIVGSFLLSDERSIVSRKMREQRSLNHRINQSITLFQLSSRP